MAKKKVKKKIKKDEIKEFTMSSSHMLKLERINYAIVDNKRDMERLQNKIEIIRLKANSEIQELTLKHNALMESSKNLKEKHKKVKEEIKDDLQLDKDLLRYDPDTGEIDHE